MLMLLVLATPDGIHSPIALRASSPSPALNATNNALYHPPSIRHRSVLAEVIVMTVSVSVINLVQHSIAAMIAPERDRVNALPALLDSGEVVAPTSVLAARRILVVGTVLVIRVSSPQSAAVRARAVMAGLLANCSAPLSLHHPTESVTTEVPAIL